MNFMSANSDRQSFRMAQLLNRKSELAYSRNDQIIYSILIFIACSILAIARILRPSPNGFGTHEQLGLPPCIFLKLTGLPCPSCGLTTSFTHAAHFHFYQALAVQPFGLLAFGLTVLSIPLLLLFIRRRVAWIDVIYARGTDQVIYLLIVAYLGSWIYKIMVMS